MEAFIATLEASEAHRDAEAAGAASGVGDERADRDHGYDPCYLGYFECFNSQRYYEAHDVLEHLWLKDGRDAPNYAFYKGLIQLAGGFVHLKLQHAHPQHAKHGRRLEPARRLFLRSMENLNLYLDPHASGTRHYQGIDLSILITLGRKMAALIEELPGNPWDPQRAPSLPLPEPI
jgi:hypothetical protein